MFQLIVIYNFSFINNVQAGEILFHYKPLDEHWVSNTATLITSALYKNVANKFQQNLLFG